MKNAALKIIKTLKGWLTKNVGYKILALVFAFILWLVVVNIQNPASTRTFTNIPVSIINEDSVLDGDHIYTIKSGDTATITVSGTRTVLAELSASDFIAVADFSTLSLTNAAQISVTLSSEKSRYANQIDINQKTRSMVIDVENVITKTVPVEIEYKGKKPDDLKIDKIVINPETVTVNVPESIAERVAGVSVTVDYTEIVPGKVMTLETVIRDTDGKVIEQENGVSVSDKTVDVAFETYIEKDVEVQAETFGTPAEGYEISGITVSRSTVRIKGPEDVLKNLTAITISKSQLNVSSKTSDVTATVELADYLPEDVSLAESEKATVIVTAHIKQKNEINN